MAITLRTKILKGNSVFNGIQMSEGKVSFFGGQSRQNITLCYGTDKNIIEYFTVNVGSKENVWFLRPSSKKPSDEQELVLVHEYTPGSGSKRWPGFWIDWDNAGPIQKLVKGSRSSGSGADTYSLVIAPMGWAENIASQFVNERDYATQRIAYNPDFKPIIQAYDDEGHEEVDEYEEEVFKEDDRPVVFDENNPLHVQLRKKGLM